jgi:RNA 2',3'-cyclic 3'-phosphodiesterase
VRLFFAVELSDEARAALGKLAPRIDAAYRWVDPALMHVTLAFLGEQPAEVLGRLESIGAATASATAPARLALGDLGTFGPRSAPRVIHVALAGDVDALARLQSLLAVRLRAEGFNLEDRPFRPHITLARRRPNAAGGPPKLASPPPLGFAMQELTVFQSKLSPKGPTYLPRARFRLGGTPAT